VSEPTAEDRARAAKVAKWLVEKDRPDEAVALLAAWAAQGPNDPAGQALLAEALRIDPSSREAQLAFERMEGISGEHELLDQAQLKYGPAELLRLESEFKRPTFRRAQMGFNNNIKSRGQVFHVQTEDSGLDAPHIITHLFADGGRVIKSHRRSYKDAIKSEGNGIADYVRNLMKAQHMEMVLALRDGKFDAIIEGHAIGGMDELTEPPKEDVIKRLKGKRADKPRVSRQMATETKAKPLYQLQVLRSLAGGPDKYEPTVDVAVVGTRGVVQLPGEPFCHPEEAVLVFKDGRLTLEDLEGGNGVFLRIRTPVGLELGDEFIVGDQLLRVEANPEADDEPDPDPTYFYSSPKWPSSFRVLQLFQGGAVGACVVARGNALQIGSAIGDLVFADDPLVDQQHCIIDEQAGTVVLTDLGSRTGVFVRIAGEQELVDQDELLVGRTRLRVLLGSP
jgi:pSer/pThr/pTyr-binding forkhead associated (FHA) protein